ncbi:MAG: sigma-70 family RNA polymerase sigma factor [Betaproteobacteria bacterium]|nr:sigma-70 family RNA polymerase sigma factor [Betaproteobacteria bacterium]
MNDGPAGMPESWLSEHGTALYRYALAQTRDEHRAEEVVQETLLAALESRSRFAGNASVRTWLISILKHKLIDLFRREARETPLDDPDDPEGTDALFDERFNASGHWREQLAEWGNPEELLERNQFLEILQRCLDALPKRLARLFWLREVMEENTETVCQELSITPTNLWTMLYRTRLRLRECVDQNWAGQV